MIGHRRHCNRIFLAKLADAGLRQVAAGPVRRESDAMRSDGGAGYLDHIELKFLRTAGPTSRIRTIAPTVAAITSKIRHATTSGQGQRRGCFCLPYSSVGFSSGIGLCLKTVA